MTWTVLGALVVAGAAFFGYGAVKGPTSASPDAGAATPCPEAVVSAIGAPGTGASLLAAYRSDRFLVTLCRTTAGETYYHGARRGQPESPKTSITLPATKEGSSWVAHNDSYAYRVDSDRLTVLKGEVVQYTDVLEPLG
ncbi:hypothetical protein JHN63_21195 [Streptomyces sp. MBT65]|uniref:hypothetical protein n=1 Tax=Streptomyces sp. MBT65 TaxID=1488395 RepID=UPI00190CA864|nr:hypothetical protein [Streptomyces sp. MBT65]MBK3576289.1 hypothetical protein [Streptomyces sp. MBT65]